MRFYINNRIKRLVAFRKRLLLNVIKEENIMEDKNLFYKGFSDSTIADAFFNQLRQYSQTNSTGNSVYILKYPSLPGNMQSE